MTATWVGAGISAAAVVVMLLIHLGVFRNYQQERIEDRAVLDKERDEDRKTTEAWRSELRGDIGKLQSELQTMLVAVPLANQRMGQLASEVDFQRGRVHEMTNMLARIDSKHDERFNAITRRMDRMQLEPPGLGAH